VGGSAFLIDAGILFALTNYLNIYYLLSSMISFTVSVIYNYILSITWVFDAKKNSSKEKELLIFMVLSIVGLGINQLLMWLLVDWGHLYYMLSKIVATGVVMVYNFVTRKLFIEQGNL